MYYFVLLLTIIVYLYRAYIFYMNAHKQFYDEERANKGIRRDVKDVIGEINRLEIRKQVKDQTDVTRPTRTKPIPQKKVFIVEDDVSVKSDRRSQSNKRVHKKITYAESSSEDEICDVVKCPVQQTKKKSKNSSNSEFRNESSKVLDAEVSKCSVTTINFDKRKEDDESDIKQSLLEQAEKTRRLEKLLEESQEMVALLLKNQTAEKSNKADSKTIPTTQESMSHITSIFGSNSHCSATLPQPQYETQGPNICTVAMTNKEFYLYHALQEKSRNLEKEFYLSAERMRQTEKDSAERLMLFNLMCNRR